MTRTDKKAPRRRPQVPPDVMTLNEVMSWNLYEFRDQHGLSQSDVAVLMEDWGFSWKANTVKELEKGSRRFTLEELGALALRFDESIIDWLLPPDGTRLRVAPNDKYPPMADGTYLQAIVKLPIPTRRKWNWDPVIPLRDDPDIQQRVLDMEFDPEDEATWEDHAIGLKVLANLIKRREKGKR